MKLNKETLKRIIKEELDLVLREEEEEEAFEKATLDAYESYAKKIGADINFHKPETIPAGISSNHPEGTVLLPRWARTGSFQKHMRNALGIETLSSEEIKNAVLDAIGYPSEPNQ